MPYNKDGSKKKNPSKKDWASYQRAQANHIRKNASGGKSTVGSAVGGGT